jgi:hypothetical protein
MFVWTLPGTLHTFSMQPGHRYVADAPAFLTGCCGLVYLVVAGYSLLRV